MVFSLGEHMDPHTASGKVFAPLGGLTSRVGVRTPPASRELNIDAVPMPGRCLWTGGHQVVQELFHGTQLLKPRFDPILNSGGEGGFPI